MSTLHIVNKSPLQQSCLKECLRVLSATDGLLLIEEGVYGADNHFAPMLAESAATLYVLESDLKARGLANRLNPKINIIDDAGFVQLVVEYAKSQSWY